MCASMADIQSATAEIRRGKKKGDRKNKKPQGKNIMSASATQGGHNKDSKQTSVSIRITIISQLYVLHGHRRSITRYTSVHGISIGSAVFAELTVVTGRQTDRPCYSVGSNRPHLRIVLRCGLVTTTLSVVNLGVSVTAWYERDEVDDVACGPRTDAVQVGGGTQRRTRRLNAG